mgnify:CR=1
MGVSSFIAVVKMVVDQIREMMENLGSVDGQGGAKPAGRERTAPRRIAAGSSTSNGTIVGRVVPIMGLQTGDTRRYTPSLCLASAAEPGAHAFAVGVLKPS